MKFGEARTSSMKKWNHLQHQFTKAFNTSTSKCGFCNYQVSKLGINDDNRCSNCKQDFPEIFDVCTEMTQLFSGLESQVERMITLIIMRIRTQVNPEGEDEK